jgi:hypothetical protein
MCRVVVLVVDIFYFFWFATNVKNQEDKWIWTYKGASR